jgi:hypothetical protein
VAVQDCILVYADYHLRASGYCDSSAYIVGGSIANIGFCIHHRCVGKLLGYTVNVGRFVAIVDQVDGKAWF